MLRTFAFLFLAIFMAGCGVTTSQLVSLRQKHKELKVVESELIDNLQVALHGMKTNPSLDARNEFANVAFLIVGDPSFEEKRFAENASLSDVNDLRKESISFLKRKKSLDSDIISIQDDIVSGHDSDSTTSKMFIWVCGVVLSAVSGYFIVRSWLPI